MSKLELLFPIYFNATVSILLKIEKLGFNGLNRDEAERGMDKNKPKWYEEK